MIDQLDLKSEVTWLA